MAPPESPSAPTAPTGAPIPWNAIAATPAFRELLRAKAAFIVPTTIFFMVYYFTLPVLAGWYPKLMTHEVFGPVNVAYLFAFSQFVMAWIIAGLYVRVAAGWDKKAAAIVQAHEPAEL